MTRYHRMVGLAAAGAVFATVLGAQQTQRIVITPYVGMYAPTTNLLELGDHSASARQTVGGALGLTGSYWLNPRVAIEVGGAYAFSDSRTSTAGAFSTGDASSHGRYTTEDAYVLLGSAKAMLGLLPPEARASLRLGFGPAIISRGGSAYESESGRITGRTELGGAISLCSKISITERLAVRARVEDYLYQARLTHRDDANPLHNIDFEKKFQSDLLFSAGLQISLLR